ncbi:hypothetical protein BB561_001527 [Smittium simulii]|uniref:6-phosphofructo-2-kinase domain-containing protein n=1 Tax=Smittium simulii TaxID=133385 RepID=A0A2T9YUB5_9FUNG|nr:hypothetical protein BB561_001527 [Smittium simulii]
MQIVSSQNKTKIAIINVGLPARGKTHSSLSLFRYLSWLGIDCKVFKFAEYRRELYGTDSLFFGSGYEEYNYLSKERMNTQKACFGDLVSYLKQEKGQIAILDGSSLTKQIRASFASELEENGIESLFIEYICDDKKKIEENIRNVKINSPDYIKMSTEEAINDFKKKIENMEPFYETIEEKNISYIKLINLHTRIITNQLKGYLPTRIAFYLMNIQVSNKRVYLAMNGQTVTKTSHDTDPILSEEGTQYANKLRENVLERINALNCENPEHSSDNISLKIWSSLETKSIQTAEPFLSDANLTVRNRMMLREIDLGICNGLSLKDIKEKYPDEFAKYSANPYYHRYPRAESYYDLSTRLEAVIMDLEREESDVLIIASASVLRCIYAYFALNPFSRRVIPSLSFPQLWFIELTPTAYGCVEKKFPLN